MPKEEPKEAVPATEPEPVISPEAPIPSPSANSNPLPIIGLAISIVGVIFSLASSASVFFRVLGLLLALAGLVIGFIALKNKKAIAITTIVLSILGLLFAVLGGSSSGSDKSKTETVKQETAVNSNSNIPVTNANSNSAVSATNANTNTPDATKTALANTFSKKEWGYSIGYPADWTKKEMDSAVEFQGPNSMLFRVQNALVKSRGGAYESVDDAIKQLTASIKQGDPKAKFGAPVELSVKAADGSALPSKGEEIDMSVNGADYKGILTVVSYAQGGVFYVVEYYAPKDKFAEATNIVKLMIDSWKIGMTQ